MGCRSLLAPGTADGPKLQTEIGKFTGNVDREPARIPHRLPVRAADVELEIRSAGIERDLPRSDWKRLHCDSWQGRVHQFAYLFHCGNSHLTREQPLQALRRHVRLNR